MSRLEEYMNKNNNTNKDSIYYNESFCNLTIDYLGSYEFFTVEDVEYLKLNGYVEEDFTEIEE